MLKSDARWSARVRELHVNEFASAVPEAPSETPSSPRPQRVLRPRRAAPADAVRPTRAEVNLANLRHNLHVVKRAAQNARVWGVLKADAYGHGAPAVARTLERAGIDGICVALLEEAIELREAGIRTPILVMGGYYGQAWGELIAHRLTPVVYEPSQIEGIAREVRYQGVPSIGVHLKVDTGMGRLGCVPHELPEVLDALQRFPEVRLEGLMTHLACADAESLEGVDQQLALFEELTANVRAAGFTPQVRHAANSAAMLRTTSAHFDVVRPGIALFGVPPRPDLAAGLRPVMRVRTEIVALRDLKPGDSIGYGWTWRATRPSRIATIPIGYADGLHRELSNVGHVLVRGKRAPIVGTISMDLTMIDVTDHPGVSLRDEAVILGAQEGKLGKDVITADEIARLSRAISWEVLTHVSRRVPRFYREA